jgi:hypothetical protein
VPMLAVACVFFQFTVGGCRADMSVEWGCIVRRGGTAGRPTVWYF